MPTCTSTSPALSDARRAQSTVTVLAEALGLGDPCGRKRVGGGRMPEGWAGSATVCYEDACACIERGQANHAVVRAERGLAYLGWSLDQVERAVRANAGL